MAKKKYCFLVKNVADPSIGPCSENLLPRESLKDEDIRLLKIRTKCLKSIKFVCEGHHQKFLKFFSCHARKCCDPFEDHKACVEKKKKIKSLLKDVTAELRDRANLLRMYLVPGTKLCVACHVKIYKLIRQAELKFTSVGQIVPTFESSPSIQSSQALSAGSGPSPTVNISGSGQDEPYQESIEGLNTWLSALGQSPISEKKLKKGKKYAEKSFMKIKAALSQYTENLEDDSSSVALGEIMQQLKEYIDNNNEQSKKILALSVLPKSWSISKVQEMFGVSEHLARKCRQVVNEKGILCTPKPAAGRPLSDETYQLVKSFHLRDDVSRPLPGSKDVVTVRENGQRVKKTKRLLLSTLGTLHLKYSEEFQNNKISRAKFCELRPKECVLAGSPGTHTICVCVHHQNPVLVFEAANLKSSAPDFSLEACMEMMMCPETTTDCYLRKCLKCPDQSALQEHLEVYFDSESISEISFNQWESTDRGNIVSATKLVDDFIADFISQVEKLITHNFITKKQGQFKRETIKNISEDEVVVNLDFAENFSFVVQNSSQGWYFNNKQATIHPCVINYKNSEGKDCVSSVAFISDHMDHSTTAVHKFQEKLIHHIKEDLQINVKKIFYFSDGCAGQYKNKKNVANVWFHLRDFGVEAEWHFFATSHGKSACDGVGGMIKHTVMLHCLRLKGNDLQITTAYTFFQWVNANIKGVKSIWVTTEEIQNREQDLEVRFKTAHDIDGIQSHHAIIPKYPTPVVTLKLFSTDTAILVKQISIREIRLDFSDVRGFVTFTNDYEDWHLGCVSEMYEENESFDIQVLVPSGKPQSFVHTDECLSVNLHNILTVVNPIFVKRGKVIKLRVADISAAKIKLRELSN